jgi:arabinose-5-phosphate isomerase
MKIIGIIPARYGSTRFPGKPLAIIDGKPMIQRVYEQAKKAIENVWIATDNERIASVAEGFGGKVFQTGECATGTERCAIVARELLLAADDIVINIQGDEPLIDPQAIGDLIDAMKEGVEIATLIGGEETSSNLNYVKVLVSPFSKNATLFSRTWIAGYVNYRHIGVYAYRVETLLMLSQFSNTDLEQLAWLDAGCRIKCVQTPYKSISVDTPEDVIAVEQKIIRNQVAEILMAERQAIINIPVSNAYAEAISIIYNRVHKQRGKLITSGIGKAGQVAHDIATTFSSTGTPAVFLHPSEAQHGDLGILQPNDVMLLITNSGETREIHELYELTKSLYENIPVIVITSHPEIVDMKKVNVCISTGKPKEVCPFGLTPTTSTTVMGVIGDALVVLMMKRIGFTKEEYAKRHHGGYIGKKLNGNT